MSRMNWAWATSLDHIWRSPSFAMWMVMGAVAGFFVLIILIMLLRAEKSAANGALVVITLLSIGVAVAMSLRGREPVARTASGDSRSAPATMVALPAMACIEDLSGDAVGQACEKVLFGSAESTAAAVNYASSMLSRLTALGDAAVAQKTMSVEMQAMRRAIEHDRYGLVAQVLLTRDRCSPTQCPAYRSLTDNHQIITNMDQHTFDNLVARYLASWNAPPPPLAATSSPLAMLPPSLPTGKPTSAEFPSAANTPAVSIMAPEPGTGAKPAAAAAAAPPQAPARAPQSLAPQSLAPPASPAPAASPAAAAKKQATAKRAPAAPTQISPATPAPAAADD
jgi:hypothetical protein